MRTIYFISEKYRFVHYNRRQKYIPLLHRRSKQDDEDGFQDYFYI
jgi:hypothetical protein